MKSAARSKRRLSRYLLITAAALTCLVALAIVTVPALQWRAQLLVLQTQGKIYDLEWAELLPMLVPGSGYYPKALVATRNPYGTIKNIHDSEEDLTAGEVLFRARCANCHGAEGSGGVGTALDQPDLKHGDTDWSMYRAITRGIPGTAMTTQNLSSEEAWQLVAYIRSRMSRHVPAPLPESAYDIPPVDSARLLAGRSEPGNWLSYSGDYDGKRYSTLAQINRETAASLQLIWIHQTESQNLYLENSPIVNEDVMYITVSPGVVQALNASTGEPIWTFNREAPEKLSLCCGTVNRGVAMHGNSVFWATLDAHILSLDAKTGRRNWETRVADHSKGYSITSAPLVVKNLVLIGVSGGEFGIRGHLDAYDIETGERVWRFYTIPGPGEPGNETWSGDSWKRGGAGAWLTGSYDPELDLLYWGTGNPGPLYYGDDRLGDNLYANSVVALDPDTGELQWHFQFTPHDLHDWAANQIPVLVDMQWTDQKRQLLLTANRNGFFYVLDRTSGEFLLAKAFVKQNWAEAIDSTGRPVLLPNAIPTPKGTITWPSPHGGTNWQSPAYSPRTELFYVAALDGGRVVYKQGNTPEYTPGEFYIGSMHQLMAGDEPMISSTKAIDPATGEVAWEYANPPRRSHWRTGGVLATAGDIIVSGDLRSVYILDARTGEELWRINVGGHINAAPVTYLSNERQLLTIAAGRNILTFGAPIEKPRQVQ